MWYSSYLLTYFLKQQEDAEIGDSAQHGSSKWSQRTCCFTVKESPTVKANKNMFYGFGFPLLCPDAWKTLLPKPSYRAEDIFCFWMWECRFGGKTEGCKQKGGSKEDCDLESNLWGHLGILHRMVLHRFRGGADSGTEKPYLSHVQISVSTYLSLLVLP